MDVQDGKAEGGWDQDSFLEKRVRSAKESDPTSLQ